MKKNLQVIIAIVIVVIVIGGTFFLSGLKDRNLMKEISYDEYKEVTGSAKKTFVYAGEKNDNYDIVKEFSKDSGIKVRYLDSTALSEKEKKEVYKKESDDTLFIYEDGKLKGSYGDDFDSYEFMKMLMENDYIEKSYLPVRMDDYLKIIKEDGYHFMFIGSDTCSYCTMFKESINKALKDHDFNVYYLDVSSLTDAEREKLYATDEYFTTEEWGTPLNFLYKDGKRIEVLNGYVEEAKLVEFLKNNKVI